GEFQPAGQVLVGAALQLVQRQAGNQCPDGFMVVAGSFAAQQGGNEYTFASGSEGLGVGLKGAGADELGAHLLVDGQFGEVFEAGVAQGLESALRLVAGHGQFGGQGTGEDLLSGLQAFHRDLLEDSSGSANVLLFIGEVGCGKAQQYGLFRL